MTESTANDLARDAAELAAAARDRGMEQIEGAKGRLADGAQRVAAAVERTAEELEGEGDGALSGVGHSVASLMRQLSGGLRDRDVAQFAGELGALARRNPGVFLAGSVALGFGIARFFKARPPLAAQRDDDWREPSGFPRSNEPQRGEREEFDAEEGLDLSAASMGRTAQAGADGEAEVQPPPDGAETLNGGAETLNGGAETLNGDKA
jgi:X-X-X-Leu-X-X-Gly heptad repeat protein